MAERPSFAPIDWEIEPKKLEPIKVGEAEGATLAAYAEARRRMGHIRRKINVTNDELELTSKNAQMEVEQLSFTTLAFDNLTLTFKQKTDYLNVRKTDIEREILSVTDKLENDLIVNDNETIENEEGESVLDIYCKNAEKVKTLWMAKIHKILTMIAKQQIYFSKKVVPIHKKEEESGMERPKTTPASPSKSISNAKHFEPVKLKFTCSPEDLETFINAFETWIGLAFRNIEFRHKVRQLDAFVDEEWRNYLKPYISNAKKWAEIVGLFTDRLKLTYPIMGRITAFLHLRSPPEMEFARWARICANTCELAGFHECSTKELMAIIALLNYGNNGVREFILERTQEDILSGKDKENVHSLENMEKMASIDMVRRVKNKNGQAKNNQGHVKGVGHSNNTKKGEEKQIGANKNPNPCQNCGNNNHSTEACRVKPCEHCDSNNWFKKVAMTHKTENCRNIQRIREAKDNQTRALRIQGEIECGTDSEEEEMYDAHISNINWNDIMNEGKDDDDEETVATGGEGE